MTKKARELIEKDDRAWGIVTKYIKITLRLLWISIAKNLLNPPLKINH